MSLPPALIVRDIIALLPTEPGNQLDVRKERSISMVVVHWSGDRQPIPEDYDSIEHMIREARYHISNDWDPEESGVQGSYGLAYHEVVDRYGRCYLTRPAADVTWSCRGANWISYNICLDATEGSPPTAKQLEVLPLRLDALRLRYGVLRSAVFGHGELVAYGNQTACPGPALLESVRRYRGGS